MPLWSLGLLYVATAAAQIDCDSIVVPPNQVGEPYAKYQTKCRGAPLLANVANGLRVVAVDATTFCDGTRLCSFDIVGCGGRSADVSKLVVVAEFVSDTVRAAAVGRIVCGGQFRESLDRGANWLGGGGRTRTILVAPPALWGLRNPGQTWGHGAAFLPLLESWAREHANASVLDFAPATLARRDATDDGMHYGHGPDDWTLPDGPARDVGSTHVALVAKLYRLMYSS